MKHGSSKKRSLEKKLAVAVSLVNVLNAGAPIALPYVHVAQNVRAEGGRAEGLADALTRSLYGTAAATSQEVPAGTSATFPKDPMTDGDEQNILNGATGRVSTMNGGMQKVNSGATGIVITMNGGTQDLQSTGLTHGQITEMNGGKQTLSFTDADASIETMNGGTQEIIDGKGSIVTMDGGTQIVNGGTAEVKTFNKGGTIIYRATNEKLTISTWAGGTLRLEGNATLSGGYNDHVPATVSDGTIVIAQNWGGTAKSFTLQGDANTNTSGVMIVSAATHGEYLLAGTVISNGGTQMVTAGEGFAGSVKNTTIHSGGTQIVYSKATAKDTTDSGGVLELHGGAILQNAGGTIAYGEYTLNGGTLRLVEGATVGNMTLGAGSTPEDGVYGTLELASGGTATGTVLSKTDNKSGVELVNGGKSISATVNDGGTQIVLAGEASGATINAGGVQEVSGGKAEATTVMNDGQQIVSGTAANSGLASNTTVSAGGMQNVGQYGVADGGTIKGEAAKQYVRAGGTAQNMHIEDGGQQIVSGTADNSGYASGTIVSSGGQQIVSAYGVAEGGTFNNSTQEIVAGGTALGVTVRNGFGTQTVSGTADKSGYASDTIVENGGTQIVSAYGVASGGTLKGEDAWGVQTVLAKGTAAGTIISALGCQYVSSGGTALDAVISAGGVQEVSAGGTALDMHVEDGGVQEVSGTADHSGYASGTVVSAGGMQNIYEYGVADGGTIKGGNAKQTIAAGGTALNMHVENGGLQSVSGTEENSGYVSGTVISAGGMQNIEQYGVAEGVTISGAGAIQNVNGGTAVSTTINGEGAIQYVYGGTVSDTTVNSGTSQVFMDATAKLAGDKNIVNSGGTVIKGGTLTGKQIVKNGGLTDGLTIDKDAVQTLEKGGTAKDTTVKGKQTFAAGGVIEGSNNSVEDGGEVSGGTLTGQQTVNGGTVTDMTIGDGGSQTVTDGTVTNVNVVRGTQTITGGEVTGGEVTGEQNVNGGAVTNATIKDNGKQNVNENGTALNTTVGASGAQGVASGGIATGTIISGGTQNVFAGATVTDTTINDGTQELYGTADGETKLLGGTQNVYEGAKADGVVVSGGTQNVFAGGTATDTIINGGTQEVHGTVNGKTQLLAGTQNIHHGVTAEGVEISGGVQNVEGAATSTTIAGGKQVISAGATAAYTTLNGGTQTLMSGTKDNSGGVSEHITLAGGTLIVDDYARAQIDTATGGRLELLQMGLATVYLGDLTTPAGTTFTVTDGYARGDKVYLGLGDANGFSAPGKILDITNSMDGYADFYINTDLAADTSDVIRFPATVTNATQANKIRINYDQTLATGATVAATDTTVAVLGAAGTATFEGAANAVGGNNFTPTVTLDADGVTWKITKVALTGPSEQLKAAEGAASARTAAWRGTASIQAVGNRLGRLRTADRMKDDIEGRVHDDIWVDFTRGRNTLGNNGRSVRATYSRVDIGFDRSVGKGWTVGAAYGLQYGTENYGIGTGNSHNDILTAYAMWQSPKDHYLEMTLRAGRFSSDYNLQDPNQAAASDGNSRTYGQAASVVYGKRMAQASDWYMEPHAGLYWAHMNGYGYDLSDGTAVHVDGSNSFIGALGVNVGRSLSNGSQFYSRLDVMHDFAGSTRTTMTKGASNTLENDFRDTWVDLMLGFARKDGVIDWYAEAGRQGMGSKECRGDWVWRVGMSYSF